MITVVIRPFKSGGKFYPAGTLVEPAGFKLYNSRLGEGKLKVVDEHNVEEVSRYLTIRQGVQNAEELLTTYLEGTNKPAVDKEYMEKVNRLAEQYDVVVEGRPLDDVVAEIKAKAVEAKAAEEQAKLEAEEQAKLEAEAKAAEEQAKLEAEKQVKEDAE